METNKAPIPFSEFVCLRWLKPEERQTESGIIIEADKSKRNGNIVKLARGEIVSWGDAVRLPGGLKKGDIVLYPEYEAQEYVHASDVHEANVYHVVDQKYIKARL